MHGGRRSLLPAPKTPTVPLRSSWMATIPIRPQPNPGRNHTSVRSGQARPWTTDTVDGPPPPPRRAPPLPWTASFGYVTPRPFPQ